MSKNVVVTAIDDNYVLPFLVMLYSAKKNAIKEFRCVLGFEPKNLSETHRDLILKCSNALNITLDFMPLSLSESSRDNNHITAIAYAKLSMADVMPGTVLWLDVDLICRLGWDKIFDTTREALQTKTLAGVKDSVVTAESYRSYSRNLALAKKGNDYFNTGVLMFNCEMWRSNGIPLRWPHVQKNYINLGFQYSDQCVINYVIKDSFYLLSSEFNVLAFHSSKDLRKRAKILHFAGPIKPWNYRKYSLSVFVSCFSYLDIWDYLKLQKEFIDSIKGSRGVDKRALARLVRRNRSRSFIYLWGMNASLKRNLPQ